MTEKEEAEDKEEILSLGERKKVQASLLIGQNFLHIQTLDPNK